MHGTCEPNWGPLGPKDAICKISGSELLTYWVEHSTEFQACHHVLTLKHLARGGAGQPEGHAIGGDERFALLTATVTGRVCSFQHDSLLMQCFLERPIVGRNIFKSQNSFATMIHRCYDAHCEMTPGLVPTLSPRGLAGVAWRCGRLKAWRCDPLVEAMALGAMAASFDAQSLVNRVWSPAKLIYDKAPLAQALAAKVRPHEFRLQWLVRTLWAFAKLHLEDGPFFEMMIHLTSEKEADFEAYDMQVTTNFV